MFGKIISFFCLLLVLSTPAFSRILYVSPNGDVAKAGTIDAPFLSIQKAQEAVSPGDTVFLRGGLYSMAEAQVARYERLWAYVSYRDKSGTPAKRINTGHTQSICFENEESNNIFEQLSMHHGQAIGFYLSRGANNLNCDAYRNYDYTSEGGLCGNVDGFGNHPEKGGVNNVFHGCCAWFNSNDGYDCINAQEATVFEKCRALYNSYSPGF